VNHAITKTERVEALNFALNTFSHKNVLLHDHEINLGADKSLCLKLGYVVLTSSSSLDELNLIGKCLLQIYQCSSEQRNRSFRSIGATELFPLLIHVLGAGVSSTYPELSKQQETVVATMVQVLRVYSKLDSAKSFLIRLNKAHWLGDVLQYCVKSIRGRANEEVSLLCLDLLGLVKDLTFRSSTSDKMVVLSVKNGIFGGLLATICEAGQKIDSRVVEWFTAVVWNLVLDKATGDQIMESERVHGFPILNQILSTLRSSPTDARNQCLPTKIKRNATSCIGNILAHKDYQEILFFEANRQKLPILSILMKLVESDCDSVVRRRAMRTIRCVASDESNVEALLEQEELAEFLVETISRNISIDDEDNRDTQIQACQTINCVVNYLSGGDWPRIEMALLQRVETTTDEKLIQAACSCLAECIKNSPWRRGSSCFSEMFWTRLEAAVSSSVETHCSIACLLLRLAELEKKSTDENSQMQPSSLTSAPVVNTLTALIASLDKDQEESRKLALNALALLVENEANKRPLAGNESLLAGLVNLCLSEPNKESKAQAKQAILDLVPEL